MASHSPNNADKKIDKAIKAVQDGATYTEAAKQHNVPRTTIYRHLTGTTQRGRKPDLTDDEEKIVVQTLIRFSTMGLPLTKTHLREALCLVVENMGPERKSKLQMKNGTPSKRFLDRFYSRHKDKLKLGHPLSQEAKRFKAFNGAALANHFATLEKVIRENGIGPERIFNLDEAGVTPDRDTNGRRSSKRFMARDQQCDMQLNEWLYSNRVTIMPIISASGEAGPPLFVFKDKLPYRVSLVDGKKFVETPADKLPQEAVVCTRDSLGGVDSSNFKNWVQKFIEYTHNLRSQDRKVLLVFDGYRSHLALCALKIFADNNIIVYALPSHTSGKTQPLDSVIFSAFKSSLKRIVHECISLTNVRQFDAFDFCALLKHAYRESFTLNNIKSSFRRCGLWPLQPSKLICMPLPESSAEDAKIIGVEELFAMLKKRREEMRSTVLGSDAKITQSGFINTEHGCVVTTKDAMELAVKKAEMDKRKKDEVERNRLIRELNATRRNEACRLEHKAMETARDKRRATLCGESLEVYRKRLRSMKTRRAIAKTRALARRIG